MRNLVILLSSLVGHFGCTAKDAQHVSSSSEAASPAGVAEDRAGGGAGAAGATAVAPGKPDPTRVIIYTAEVTLYVDSLAELEKQLPAVLDQYGAYISDSQTSRYSGNSRRAKWTVRVPAAQYKHLLAAVGGLGAVDSSTTKAEDVTAEFVDVEARLKNQRSVEDRLQAILKQQSGKIADVLEVEREIARVREEIERAEGRIRYMKNLSSLSTVTLSVFEREGYQALPSEPTLVDRIKWAWQESTHGVVEFGKWLVVFIVRLVPWLPLWIALGFGVRVLVRRLRARKAAKPKGREVSDS